MRLLLPLLIILSLRAATAQDFHRYYDLGGAESIRDLIVLSPERLIAIGNSRDDQGAERSILLTLDGKGEVLRSTTLDYDLRTRGMALARQTDSTFWMGCWRTPFEIVDDWTVYRVNANTGTATGFGWGAVEVDEQIRAMAAYPDGGVVVVGNTGDDNQAIISRLDAQGNELFRKGFTIPDNQYTIFSDVKIAPDGSIFVAGDFQLTGTPTSKNGYLVAEFSPTGTLLRSRRYDFPGGEEGSDGAGAALEFLPQGFMAIAGSRRVEGGRVSVTFIIDQGLAVAGAFQREAFRYSTASDLLAIEGNQLLIVGSGLRDETADFGLVTVFDVSGTGTPLNVTLGTRLADNRLAGLAARPGGGYLFFGQGNLCPGEDGSDGLIISIGPDLTDTVANCHSLTGTINGREIFPASAQAGLAFDRQDPRFDPPEFTPVSAATKDQFCPRIATFPAPLADPVCYEEPFFLLDSAVLVSPPGTVERITVFLAGANAGAGGYLEISDPPTGVSIEGNRSGSIMLSVEEQGGTSELLLAALSRLRFGVGGAPVAGGEQIVRIDMASKCESGDLFSFRFNLAPYLPAPFGLPSDTSFCSGNELVLAGPEIDGVSYRWSNGDETRTTVAGEAGDYTLSIMSGCREDSATVRVTEVTDAVTLLDFTLRESVCLGDSLIYQPPSPETGISYAWSDGLPGEQERVIRKAGTYQLLRTNACYEAVTTVNVVFRDCCQIYLPNAFSPNGDGINDVFRAFPDTEKCSLVTDYELRVYDRWGGAVYLGTEFTTGWDGRVGEDRLGNGHYVYTISYFNGLETVRRSGGLVLLR